MVHIVIIAHFGIANSLIYCAEKIFSIKIKNLHYINVEYNNDSIDTVIKTATKLCDTILLENTNNQILLLTDLLGATPYNIAHRLLQQNQIELLTGLNLPMLLRAITYMDFDLNTCVAKAMDAAITSIYHQCNIQNTNDNTNNDDNKNSNENSNTAAINTINDDKHQQKG